MDRRSFMLGLAATTAAVPIVRLMPAAVGGWTPGTIYEVGDLVAYGRSPAMDTLDVLRWWQGEATRELHRVMAMPPEWLR